MRKPALHRADGAVVVERCLVAATPFARMRGLLGRRELPSGEGVLLKPAGSIHTFFMRFPIDAVFLGADGEVLRIAPSVRPWRTAAKRGARAVLEVAAGECERRGIRPGDRLEVAAC